MGLTIWNKEICSASSNCSTRKKPNTFSGRNHTAALLFALSLHVEEYK
jgi:hypothetical protein